MRRNSGHHESILRKTARRRPAAGLGLLVLWVLWGQGAWATSGPAAVSPGDGAATSVAAPCPTFSWGRLEGALSYELVAYRVGEEDVETDPLLSQEIPGSASSWTPSLDRCLEPGEAYAWTVRAVTAEGLSEWAAPLLFEVATRPSAEELAAALEVVRRHLGAEAGPQERAREPSDPREDLAAGELRPLASPVSASPAASSAGNPTAQVTVTGEVRTVDSGGEARLGGKGRPDIIVFEREVVGGFCSNSSLVKFGLSSAMTDWGSAADACPVGTWVCRLSDLEACNSKRPDTSPNGLTCAGSIYDFAENNHFGWTANSFDETRAAIFRENGIESATFSCDTFPVWCCW